jgi:hypothetical protein
MGALSHMMIMWPGTRAVYAPTHRLEGLPLDIYGEGGMVLTKPCAEVLLSERIVEVLEDAGIGHRVSYHGTDIVALPWLQSLGEPCSPLRWIRQDDHQPQARGRCYQEVRS